jgi:arginine decarboxylase
LVVLVAGTGASGIAVEQDLLADGLPVEMADHDTVVPIITMADTDETVDRLVTALIAAVERRRGQPRGPAAAAHWGPPAVAAMTPREAFFARHRVVDAEAAIGRVSAELVAPYPPGVPVLVPGEVVTAEAVHALREAYRHGIRIAYAADPTLHTLQIVS